MGCASTTSATKQSRVLSRMVSVTRKSRQYPDTRACKCCVDTHISERKTSSPGSMRLSDSCCFLLPLPRAGERWRHLLSECHHSHVRVSASSSKQHQVTSSPPHSNCKHRDDGTIRRQPLPNREPTERAVRSSALTISTRRSSRKKRRRFAIQPLLSKRPSNSRVEGLRAPHRPANLLSRQRCCLNHRKLRRAVSNRIIRAPRRHRFLIADQQVVDDRRLSWAARGMLVYLFACSVHRSGGGISMRCSFG